MNGSARRKASATNKSARRNASGPTASVRRNASGGTESEDGNSATLSGPRSTRGVRFSRCPGWGDRAFGVGIDVGLGSSTRVSASKPQGRLVRRFSAVVDVPHMDESAHVSGLNEVAERWLNNWKYLLEATG